MERNRSRGGKASEITLGNFIDDRYGTKTLTPYKVTDVSLFERCTDLTHPNHPHEGGPFNLERYQVNFKDGEGWHGSQRRLTDYNFSSYYRGKYRASYTVSTIPARDTTSAEKGALAWERFKPAQPDVSLAVFFAELKDIGGLIFKDLNKFRGIGKNFLAVEFGWKPFLRDIQDWYSSVKEIDTKVAQLQRDNGRWIRRGGTLEQSRTVTSSPITPYGQIKPLDPSGINAVAHRELTKVERVWFSAAFRYYIPGINHQKWGKLRAIQELYDLKITPEQVYQLIPFSWLVDWHSNLGSVISNLQSSIDDHLVAKYAYVMRMRETVEQTNCSMWLSQRVQAFPSSSNIATYYSPVQCSVTRKTVTKARAVANPFGFSTSLPRYTSWQKNIIAALGLSKLRA